MSFTGTALSWERVDDALEVRLHREPCNEIGTTSLAELERLAACVRSGAEGARSLILYSSMRGGFSAGADLRELHEGLVARRERWASRMPGPVRRLGSRAGRLANPLIRREVRGFLERIHRVFDTLDSAPIPTIGVVHGVCFGGGFELALTTDMLIAEKSARFCFPELRLGLVPGFGGIPRLERDVGSAVVRDLLLTGRSLSARRAHEVGLVSQLVPRERGLLAARSVARQAVKFDRHTVTAAKAFAKRIPEARLQEERDTFCRLITQPAVSRSLARFVDDLGPTPWLP